MIFDHTKHKVVCPHCKTELLLFDSLLELWQCPSDNTVYDQESFGIFEPVAKHGGGEIHPDLTLAAFTCPKGSCDI